MPHNRIMKWGPLIGWGIVIYAVTGLAWGLMNVWQITEAPGARTIVFIASAVVALIAGRTLRFSARTDIFPYSFAWMIEYIVLDVVYTVPYYGWGVFHDPTAWIIWGLVLAAPLFAPNFRRSREVPRVD